MITAHWDAPLLDNDVVVACAKAAVLSGRPMYVFNPTTRVIRRGELCVKVKPGAARLLTRLLIAGGELVSHREVYDLCAPIATQPAASRNLVAALRRALAPLGIDVPVCPGHGYYLRGPIQLCHPLELADAAD